MIDHMEDFNIYKIKYQIWEVNFVYNKKRESFIGSNKRECLDRVRCFMSIQYDKNAKKSDKYIKEKPHIRENN
jgi:hypothetical protein